MRQRINITVSPAFYDELQRIRKDYGFVNVCEICTALLHVFADHVRLAEQAKQEQPPSVEDFIGQMFSDFANWEPTPNADIVLKRVHAHPIDGKYFDRIMTDGIPTGPRRARKTDEQTDYDSDTESAESAANTCSYYDDTDFDE